MMDVWKVLEVVAFISGVAIHGRRYPRQHAYHGTGNTFLESKAVERLKEFRIHA